MQIQILFAPSNSLKIEEIHPKSNSLYEMNFDIKSPRFFKFTFINKIGGSWPSSSSIYSKSPISFLNIYPLNQMRTKNRTNAQWSPCFAACMTVRHHSLLLQNHKYNPYKNIFILSLKKNIAKISITKNTRNYEENA